MEALADKPYSAAMDGNVGQWLMLILCAAPFD
jgi:hypothetical protein